MEEGRTVIFLLLNIFWLLSNCKKFNFFIQFFIQIQFKLSIFLIKREVKDVSIMLIYFDICIVVIYCSIKTEITYFESFP